MATATRFAARYRPVSMSGRASADLLIDAARLSELVGREVQATRLRFKPGLSTTAVLLDTAREVAPHWIQVSHDAHLDKLRNALDRAEERAQRVHLVRTGDLTIVHGSIDTDPRLQKGLDGLRAVHPFVSEAVTMGDLHVLRYNPLRRLVLRREVESRDPQIVRITAHPQRGVRRQLAAYQAAGVPVIHPDRDHPVAGNKRVTAWPWFGRGDLSTLVPQDAVALAPAAGAALGLLHGADVASDEVTAPADSLRALVEHLGSLDQVAASRMDRAVTRLEERLGASDWAVGTIHGDFSADQVLVGREGEDTVRLTDFDRTGCGALMADLGTFGAAELTHTSSGAHFGGVDSLPLTGAILTGYAETPASLLVPPDEGSLRTWVARALLARATEPFRAGEPDWLEGIHRRLDQVEAVLR
ncbi:phosphotransferase [Ornithinimicrobium murale]|uniref:phosphotransferase n=1 Tax=Ornithinimicrobium murale TaxID=1050153 RepID=UPI000E0D9F3A|nr:phosphotransferase [Ornithinimicrobium murale]